MDKVNVDFAGNAWIDAKDLFSKRELKKVIKKFKNSAYIKNNTYIRKNNL